MPEQVDKPQVALAAASIVGRVFGGSYRVVRCLAEGGMASVFEAEHVRLKRPVAVKVIAEHLADNPEAQARFQREADTISQLQHPNIVHVLDYDTTPEGEPYLVMELLQGESLADRLNRDGNISLEQMVLIVWQVASALEEAHRKGIVHRDLTPANVFLTSLPGHPLFVKLLDFGISKAVVGARNITQHFQIVGTVQYMAPEQAVGGIVDMPVDQFALACIVYRALSGKLPFEGQNATAVLQAVAFKPHAAIRSLVPELPAAVEQTLDRALRKDPSARYPRISDFAVELARAAGSSLDVTFSTAPPPLVAGNPVVPRMTESSADPFERVTLPAQRLEVTTPEELTRRAPPPLAEAATQLSSTRRAEASAPTLSPSEALDDAERALDDGDVDRAWARLCALTEVLDASPALANHIIPARLEQLYIALLGGLQRNVWAEPATSTDGLTPEHAFLLSRVESGLTIEELLDLAHSGRRQTLHNLVALSRSGRLRLG